MNRRGFLGALGGAAAMPALKVVPEAPKAKAELVVGADLSMTSLTSALLLGKERGYGNPQCLIIGPENLFPAREILGDKLRQDTDPNILWENPFGFRVVSALPMNFWMVQFEKGTVSSQGP